MFRSVMYLKPLPISYPSLRSTIALVPRHTKLSQTRHTSTSPAPPSSATPRSRDKDNDNQSTETTKDRRQEVSRKPEHSSTERDADYLSRMQEVIGGADMANSEMEDGLPDRGMRRNVRANMFRII